MRLLPILAALLVAAPAGAQAPDWPWAEEREVLLTSFEYEPKSLRLKAGEPVTLRFHNGGRATLVFQAKDFFRKAQIRSRDSDRVVEGKIRVAPGEAVSVALVPAPGRYHVRSSNLLHRILGMTGEIVVE